MLSYNERNIVLFLIQEKKILNNLHSLAGSLVEMSKMTKKEALAHLFKHHKFFKNAGALRYVRDDFIPLLRDEQQDGQRIKTEL